MLSLSLPFEIVNCILSFNDKELYRNKHTKQMHIRIKQKYMDDTFSYLFKNMKKELYENKNISITNHHNSLYKIYQFTRMPLLTYEEVVNYYNHCTGCKVTEVDIPIIGLNPEEFYVEDCYICIRPYDSDTCYAETITFILQRKWNKCV
jgi:hypothetical protein